MEYRSVSILVTQAVVVIPTIDTVYPSTSHRLAAKCRHTKSERVSQLAVQTYSGPKPMLDEFYPIKFRSPERRSPGR